MDFFVFCMFTNLLKPSDMEVIDGGCKRFFVFCVESRDFWRTRVVSRAAFGVEAMVASRDCG
jgi:hypothetical protein